MEPVSTAVAASFLPETLGGWLSAGSSAASLLGGLFGGGGGNNMKQQFAYNMASQYYSPIHQVRGMRAAGLNPMLAATKGLNAAPTVSNNPVDDRAIALQKASALSMISNNAAQTQLYRSQSDLAEAQAEKTRSETPANDLFQEGIASASALNRQRAQTEIEEQAVRRSVASLNYAHETLAEANVQTAESQQFLNKWLARAKRFEVQHLMPQELAQMKVELNTLDEQLKTAVRKGELDETTYARVMGYVGKFFENLPFGASANVSRTYPNRRGR